MEYEKKQRIYKTIMLAILVAIVTFILTTVMLYNRFEKVPTTKYVMVGNTQDNSIISRLKSIVDKCYLGNIDENKMNDEAAKGYINGLGDQYSEYITKDEYEQFSSDIFGSFCGIGIYFGKTYDDEILIVSTIEDSPAEKAGLKSGDVITKVDDYVVTTEDTATTVSDKIKGQEGTFVAMEIKRKDETLKFDIKRETVKVHQVKAEVIENDIGYIQLISFDQNTASEFKTKFEELKQKNIKSLIIDLRNNTGGIVQEATQIADYFLDKGSRIIAVKDKNGNEEITNAIEDKYIDIPTVVLVNGYTASSSEILASALRDNNVAKLVGVKTFGKGIIQNVYRLSDGSAIKLTTHEYYTANGTKLNGIGIYPNEEVELPDGTNVYTVTRNDDTQLKKAIELLK